MTDWIWASKKCLATSKGHLHTGARFAATWCSATGWMSESACRSSNLRCKEFPSCSRLLLGLPTTTRAERPTAAAPCCGWQKQEGGFESFQLYAAGRQDLTCPGAARGDQATEDSTWFSVESAADLRPRSAAASRATAGANVRRSLTWWRLKS